MEMNRLQIEKKLLVEKLLHALNLRKIDLENTLASTKESRDNDTKSSAGDKFETGRAMMQQEMDKLEQQLHQLQQQIFQLSTLNTESKQAQVGFGSLVTTENNSFFLAIPFGKINVHNQNYWVISTASPVGKTMLGKKAGDSFDFQGRVSQIIATG